MFGKQKETKEEKQARKEQELLEKYGLQELSDPQDVASVRKIAQEKAAGRLPGALPPLKRRRGCVGVFFMSFERIVECLSDDRRADPRDNAETGNDRRGRNDRTHLFNRRLTSDCTAA